MCQNCFLRLSTVSFSNKEMIGSKDESGKTALMIACSENESPDIAQMLIKHGAKILDQDHGGHTPIFEAGLCEKVLIQSQKNPTD